MPADARCPDAATLAALHAGWLSDAALDAVAGHVSECPACAAALDTLPEPADDLLTALSRPPLGPAEDESAVVARRLEAALVAPTTAPPAGPPPGPRPTGPAPGAVLGQYELTAELGRGGMGQVFAARHRLMNRRVAVKVIRGEHFNRALAGPRFRREIEALARLDHPHVVRALDADEADGLHFLVMEFVEGETLAGRVRRAGPLPVAETCRLMAQAADALDYAHRQGVVHRDVKPANFIVTPDGTLKLLDLGLARFRDDAAPGDSLTGTGEVFGTPDYMAPEQWDDARAADARADLYSLGCTFFFALTGQAPFGGPGVTTSQKMWAHASKSVPSVRERRPDVPAGLAAVIERLMAKTPADRYQTPAELRAALAPFAEGRPAAEGRTRVQRPAPGPASAGAAWRRWAVAGSAVGLALFAVAVLREPGPAPSRPAPPAPEGAPAVAVTALRVERFSDAGQAGLVRQGVLGHDTFRARRNDLVKVEATLSRPAHAFLVAFNPAGEGGQPVQLGWPDDPAKCRGRPTGWSSRPAGCTGSTTAPGCRRSPWSRRPARSRRSTTGCRGRRWAGARGPATAGVVWAWEAGRLRPQTAPGAERGTVVADPAAAAIEALAARLRAAPGVEVVALTAFAVTPD